MQIDFKKTLKTLEGKDLTDFVPDDNNQPVLAAGVFFEGAKPMDN